MKYTAWLLGALSLINIQCTHQYYDRSHSRAAYYSDNSPNILLRPDRPQDVNLGSKLDEGNNRYAMNETDALLGLVLSGASLALNPDYYRKSSIGGKCFIRARYENGIDVPCMHIQVILSEKNGAEVMRLHSDSGEFAFFVDEDKFYEVKILAEGYHMEAPDLGPLKMGDEVLFYLVRNRVAE